MSKNKGRSTIRSSSNASVLSKGTTATYATVQSDPDRTSITHHDHDDDNRSSFSFLSDVDEERSQLLSEDDCWHGFFPPARNLVISISDYLKLTIDGRTQKKSYMLGARELTIAWRDDSRYWAWTTSHPDSRFPKVVELMSVWWLEIIGKIKKNMLSPDTTYVAVLVFKLAAGFSSLGSAKAWVRFVNSESDEAAEKRALVVHLQPPNKDMVGQTAVKREDGWMEAEIGKFYINKGDDDDHVEGRLLETSCWKKGLIVEGIEFRPYITPKED